MTLTRALLLALLLACAVVPSAAQWESGHRFVALLPGEGDDPGYILYRKAYGLVLQAKWKEAESRFHDFLSRYPRSRYVEDAGYWAAFTLSMIDRDTAVEAYNAYLKKYPGGRYFSDAVADLLALQMGSNATPPDAPDALPRPVSHPDGELTLQLHLLTKRLERVRVNLHRALTIVQHLRFPDLPPSPLPAPMNGVGGQYLEGLPPQEDNRNGLSELRALAIDHARPPEVRAPAIRALSRLKAVDPLPTLAEIARRDADEELRNLATICIGRVRPHREKAFTTLTDLYATLPRSETDQRVCALDALADLGGERSLGFLAGIARGAEGPEIRCAAINNIVRASPERGRTLDTLTALFSSLPKGDKEALESTLYAIADLGGDRAVDFLASVARTTADRELRTSAIYYLGNLGGSRAEEALYRILDTR